MKDILITSSVLIVVLLLLRAVFRNTISRRVQYALWGLVLLRLLVPINLPALEHSVLTITNPVSETVERQLENQMLYAFPTEVYDSHLPPEKEPYTDRTVHSFYDPATGEGRDVYSGGVVVDHESTTHYFFMMPISEILPYIWYTGMAVMVICFLASNLHFWHKLRKNRILYPIRALGHKVYLVQEGLLSPCIFGVFRPAIYLTPAAIETPETLRHVITHETTHARHLDPLWSLLRSVCLVVYWFNPLVWVAAIVSKTDCELACDEGAMKRLGEDERLAYGRTLLSLIPVRKSITDPLLSATTMTADKKRLKDRITRIAEKRQTVAAALFLVTALVLVLCVATFAGRKTSEPDAKIPPQEESTDPAPLDIAIDQAILEHWNRTLPADYLYSKYALLSYETYGNETTAYVLTLYCGGSGSPATTEEGEPVIYCGAYLPAKLTFLENDDDRYTLLDYWEPSQENYKEDIRIHFPSLDEETMDEYTATLLKDIPDGAHSYFLNGPVWPAYWFSDAVTNEWLCRMVDYYVNEDYYGIVSQRELAARFQQEPASLINAIGSCDMGMWGKLEDVLISRMDTVQLQAALSEAKLSSAFTRNGLAVLHALQERAGSNQEPVISPEPETPAQQEPPSVQESEGYTHPLAAQQYESYEAAVAYLDRYYANWEATDGISFGNIRICHYQSPDGSHAMHLLTESGKQTPLRLPYIDAAHRYAEPENFHTDLNEKTYTYEAVVPKEVRHINTNTVVQKAGLYRYIIDLNAYTCTDIFIPAEERTITVEQAYEYYEYSDKALGITPSTLSYDALIAQLTATGAVSGGAVAGSPTGTFWEDGSGNVAYISFWGGVSPSSYSTLTLRLADGTQAYLELPTDVNRDDIMPVNAYFENNSFVYEFAADRISIRRPIRFIVNLKEKTISLDVM